MEILVINILIFIILITALFINIIIKDKLNPINVNISAVTVVVVMYFLNSRDFIKINNITFIISLFSILLFQFGFYFGTKVCIKKEKKKIKKFENSKKKLKVLFIVSFIIFLLFIVELYFQVKRITYTNNIVGKAKIWYHLVRHGEIKAPYIYVLMSYYSVFFRQVVIYLYVTKYDYLFLKRLYLILGLFILIIGGSRINLIMFIIIITYINYLQNKSLKKILLAIPITLGLFLYIGLLQNKIQNIKQTFSIYILGGIKGLDIFLQKDFVILYGERTFRSIKAILYKIGIINSKPIELIQEYSNDSNLNSNVFTVLKPYIEDFGILGGMCCFFLIGFLYGKVYRKYRNGNLKYMHLNALLVAGLLFYFFDDNLIKVLSTWIQILFYLYLFYNKKIFSK